MKLINNYWVDENNNKWNEANCSEEQAIENSKSLINCSHCSDSSDLFYCSYCFNCSDLFHCFNCSDLFHCSDCSYSSNLSHCSRCSYSSNLSHCSYCSDCSYSSNLSHCSRCSDFKSNPQRIVSDNIGSRKSQTTIYFNNEKTLVICGCYKGTLQEFKDRVCNVYSKDTLYYKEYFNFINRIEKYIKGE
jgi:hypothetical protein